MVSDNKHVRMIETGNNRWDLIGPKGNPIASDVLVYSQVEAEEWVKAYISSFLGWTYEVIKR